jgi:hypothetical protein
MAVLEKTDPNKYFSEFEHEGVFFLTVGLLHIWWNPKMSAREDFHADPPVFIQAYNDWITAHPNVGYDSTPFVGPPMWKFPSEASRQDFKDTFLETPERMRAIMDEQIAARKAEERQMWFDQGKRRNERGRPYITKVMKRNYNDAAPEPVDILLFPDPETGEHWI